MATWREQDYPGRGNGWVVECSVCGWWKAPVWNRLDAICDCGTHELICPGPADNPYPPFFRASPEKDSSSEEDPPIRPDKNDGEQAMIVTKPKAGEYYAIKDDGLDRLVRIGRVARERGTATVYAWYREHSWSTGQELVGAASRRELYSFMRNAKAIPNLPAAMAQKKAEREALEAEFKAPSTKKEDAVRRARVEINPDKSIAQAWEKLNTVKVYLPGNYAATLSNDEDSVFILIEGTDDHGWTLDGYVIPRLGSGLIVAREI